VDYVGLGSDFDGVAYMPTDLGNVSQFVDITVELIDRCTRLSHVCVCGRYLADERIPSHDGHARASLRFTRGYTDDEIKKVLGLNTIRVLRQAEAVSARLRKTTRPSDAVCC
jgi:microsomal dipeptidase-like Zn-dependent dipeptidase